MRNAAQKYSQNSYLQNFCDYFSKKSTENCKKQLSVPYFYTKTQLEVGVNAVPL